MTRLIAGCLIICAAAAPAAAGDWPCWRGPSHNGISDEKGWLDRWPKDGPPVLWKAAVGTGFSSMAVSGGRLYTLGHHDEKDTVYCLDAATGKKLWSHTYPAELGDNYFEGGPAATPTVHDGAVYTLSRWGDLFCFDAASGKVRWSKNVQKETDARVPDWGFAGSPLVHGDLLILNVGASGLALERATGKLVWKSGREEAGYSTPLPFRRGEEWYVLLSSGSAYLAVSVKSGKVLWQVRWVTRFGVNAADPVLAGDHVFLSSGYNKGASLLKMGDGEPAEVWRNKHLCNQFNSSVLVDGYLYGPDGDTTGVPALKCVELKTGEVRWSHEGLGSGGLMAADGKLILLGEGGELIVAKASPDRFAPTARAKVHNDKCWTVPVLSDGRIYCRSAAGDIVCVDVRAGKPK
jgi:outer membrane protein assembly factor BamB